MTSNRNRRGFSLLEVLMSMSIIVVAAIGLAKLHVYVVKSNEVVYRLQEALYIAESRLEYFRAHSPDGRAGSLDFDSITSGAEDDDEHGYKIVWSVTDRASYGGYVLLKTIDITVSWLGRYGQVHMVQLRTAVSSESNIGAGLFSHEPTLRVTEDD